MKNLRKALALVMSIVMLVSLCAASLTVTAAQDETVIIAGSDYQTGDGTVYIDGIMKAMEKDAIHPDKLFFGGDYSLEHSHATSTAGVTQLKNYFSSTFDEADMVFTQGNHDPSTTGGLTGWGNLDPAYGAYGLYVIEDPNLAQEWGSYDAASVAALELYLDKKVEIGFSKPIFIINHFPLHWGNRTQKDGVGTNAFRFFNVINEAAGQGLNIIYLFGHNHSNGYDDFLGGSSIFLKKGDTMQVCQGTKKEAKWETLNFTYMNMGYTGYYQLTGNMDGEDALTMSVFRIRGNEVIISRYSADGVHNLKSAGVTNPNFTYETLPTTNTTVYAGSYKIAADGTATSVSTIREMNDEADVYTGVETSISEDVRGLAFRFNVNASGIAVAEGTTNVFDPTNATVKAFGDAGYQLVSMGAIVTNDVSLGTDGSAFFLDQATGGHTIDVPCKYLCDLENTSAAFAVRITDIPESKEDAAIYARPYYVFDYNGTEITVYGDIVGASYSGKLSTNDGELEW